MSQPPIEHVEDQTSYVQGVDLRGRAHMYISVTVYKFCVLIFLHFPEWGFCLTRVLTLDLPLAVERSSRWDRLGDVAYIFIKLSRN